MTASGRAKQLGAPSLKWVAMKSGYNYRNLFDMYRLSSGRFDIIVAGTVTLYGDDKLNKLKAQLEEIMRML